LDHVALTLGFFVVQTKLRVLVNQNILNIYHAYAEWEWHFLGFKIFAESITYGISYLWSLRIFLLVVIHAHILQLGTRAAKPNLRYADL